MSEEHADLLRRAWQAAQHGELVETAAQVLHGRRHRWSRDPICTACRDDVDVVAEVLLRAT